LKRRRRGQPTGAPALGVEELIREAVVHYDGNRPGEAVECCDRAIRLAPERVAPHVYRGLALRRLSRLEEALASFEQALSLDRHNPATFEQLGLALVELNRDEKALAVFHQALALDETRLIAWVNVGNVELGRRNFETAEVAYRRALELNPGIAICHQNLCWLLRRLERFDEAVAAGRRAVELAPHNVTSYNYLIFALLAADECAAAIEVCDTSLRLDRRNTSALAYKPSALQGVERLDEGRALVDLERLVSCGNITAVPGFESLGQFNAALADYVVASPTRPYDDTQTVDLLAKPRGPVATLKSVIDNAVTRYVAALPNDPKHPFLAAKPRHWRLDGWATLLTGTPVQEHHFHQHGWISGVYYVKVPDFIGKSEADNAGFIEFCRFPQYSTRPVVSEFVAFAPYEGMLILFPSYFYHRVVEFPDSERRVSFAFNVTPSA
jgi:tetratricopeptide (TPR) repeat protein